ncbi:hypothetical protein RHGRI_026383 [Rhododendron griersonianum]|uniref:Uncharacterized protein n=1 Tax=Rhododendron griersonianum TaxID=479676 RepID=A0AAV6ILG1_9ERIC|nr:hypothetical protein RHGRI_029724 [Rhododendron griersonianum]KAG5531741.1 hypothetical protein RHGRI_026383 [Rhododendron griersonianum]
MRHSMKFNLNSSCVGSYERQPNDSIWWLEGICRYHYNYRHKAVKATRDAR